MTSLAEGFEMNLHAKEKVLFQKVLRNSMFAFLFIIGIGGAHAAVIFFEDDFEEGTIDSQPNPKWSWKPPISQGNISSGMMYGDTDIYTVTDDIAFSGNYSLRLNFSGRNGWCNECGSKDVTLSQNDINSGCVAITGAPWGSHLYNQTNGFSKWEIESYTNNEVCFNTSTAAGNSMILTNSFSAGDGIKVPYQCNVNGIVGGRIDRRSDCNKAINYLDGVSDADLGYGKTVSRRFYLYIPSATTLPNTTLKLGYAHFNINGSVVPNTMKLSVQRGLSIEATLPGGKFVNPIAVVKDKWFYFEEVWRRETSAGASDGEYKFYFSPADDFNPQPLLVQANLTIGRLVDMSINGNFQHKNDANGYVYFDNVLISDSYSGPLDMLSSPTDISVE